jgi:histone-lysine N-methyltransferase SETMAR
MPQKISNAKICWKISCLEFLGSRRHPPHYLPNGQTINAEYYSCLLVQLKDILKEKCCTSEGHQGGLVLACNTLAHQALATQKKVAYLGFQCLDHPPYSPDIAPLDYHLFPGLKKQLKGCHFS